MAEYFEEEFSKEELAALGEEKEPVGDELPEGEPEESPEESTEQVEETETEQAASAEETQTEEEKIDPIQKRIDRLTWERHETERKFDLFKRLGPERYYEAYPDERPQEEQQPIPQQHPVQQPVPQDIGSMIVRQPGGPYDGMTLRDVYIEDPVFATNLQTQFIMSRQQEAMMRQAEEVRVKSEAQQEIESFADMIAAEEFNLDAKSLTPEQEARVAGTIQQVLDWMGRTRRGGGNIADAYFLMNKEGLIKKAAAQAGQKAIQDLAKRQGPPSIDTTGGGTAQDTGFAAMEKMTETQLLNRVDRMNDKELAKFLSEAPQSLRSKHPTLPWG